MQIALNTGWTFSQIGDLTRMELITLFGEFKKERQENFAQQTLFNAGLFKGSGYLARSQKEANQAGEKIIRQVIENAKKILEEQHG